MKTQKFFSYFLLLLSTFFCIPFAFAAGGPYGGFYGGMNVIGDGVSFYVVNRQVVDFRSDILMACTDPTSDPTDFSRVFTIRGEDLDGRVLPTIRINRDTGRGRATFTYRDPSFRIGEVRVRFRLQKRGLSRVRVSVLTTPDGGSNESCEAIVNFVEVVRNSSLLPSE